MRRDLTDALISSGTLSGASEVEARSTKDDCYPLLAALQFASTSNLARVRMPEARFEESSSGAVRKQHESREVRFFDQTERVFVHPSSSLFSVTKMRSGFATFFEKVLTSKPFIRTVAEGKRFEF